MITVVSFILAAMNLLSGFLQVLFCFGIYGSLADENLFLSSDSESGPLPLENTVGGATQLSLGLDSAISVIEDPASLIFPLEDISTFSLSNGGDSESDLFSTEPITGLLPDDGLIFSNEGLRVDDSGSSSPDGLLASSSGASCLSDADGGQFISRIKRRADATSCSNPNVLNKDPSKGSNHLPPNPRNIFPPPGSRPDRLPGSYNDPKPRNPLTYPVLNTDFDFMYCPSGINGFRTYAVCDSGFERYRIPTGPVYTLIHVTRRKSSLWNNLLCLTLSTHQRF